MNYEGEGEQDVVTVSWNTDSRCCRAMAWHHEVVQCEEKIKQVAHREGRTRSLKISEDT
jgi:hypothetical protein